MICNSNLKFVKNSKFPLFVCENFLDQQFYNELDASFPYSKNGEFDEKIFKNQKNNKFVINTDMQLYYELLDKNEAMRKFHKLIINQKFINLFYKKLYFHFLSAKKNKFQDIKKLLKIPKLSKDINDHFFFKKNVRVTFEYSYILNGGKIVPHTDNPTKLLSLMLYFPKYRKTNDKNEYLYEKEKQLGTQFWNSKFLNYENIHQFDNLEDKFINNKTNIPFYKTPYVSNNLYGFIKSTNSWHSVNKINMYEKYIRRSININFHF